MRSETTTDVLIIGAGASGLFCAAECGRRGRSVLVLDHAPRVASKVLISGGGRCNFTNRDASYGHYRSRNPDFCRSALARFTPRDILSLAEDHGVAYFEKEAGQMFCVKSSRGIVEMLQRECGRAGVHVRPGTRIVRIAYDDGYIVETSAGVLRSSSLVIATGGLSYGNLGASGFGHALAKQFGLAVVPPRPALVPFVFAGRERRLFGALAGISLDAVVTCGGRSHRGSLLFTHKGLSGPAALQASLDWSPGEPLVIDLRPDGGLLADLVRKRRSRMELRTFLAGTLPKRFSEAWCEARGGSRPLDQTSDKELREIAEGLCAWKIVPKGTEGYATAEVTAGGVETDELSSKTMEAKNAPGLFFIGEVVDVTGELGGYNLHWAWASGFAAGQAA